MAGWRGGIRHLRGCAQVRRGSDLDRTGTVRLGGERGDSVRWTRGETVLCKVL